MEYVVFNSYHDIAECRQRIFFDWDNSHHAGLPRLDSNGGKATPVTWIFFIR